MAVNLINHTVDARGQSCPMPIVMTAKAMRQLAPGDIVEVLATDPGSIKDFEAWSRSTGNALIERSSEGGVHRFILRRK
jgi:tRNA 2-thiouridine synthesizing protein A